MFPSTRCSPPPGRSRRLWNGTPPAPHSNCLRTLLSYEHTQGYCRAIYLKYAPLLLQPFLSSTLQSVPPPPPPLPPPDELEPPPKPPFADEEEEEEMLLRETCLMSMANKRVAAEVGAHSTASTRVGVAKFHSLSFFP